MLKESENWITVADRSLVGRDSVVAVKAGDLDIALYNIEGQFYATSNVCTHAHALLSDGWLDGDVIECPLHGGRFEVKTGKGLGAPITCDLKTFPVRVEGNAIQVNADRLILRAAADADLGLEVLPKRCIGSVESRLQVDFKDIPGADKRHLIDLLYASRSAGHHDDLVG